MPRDPEKEKRAFIDDMFGHDLPMTSPLLQEDKPDLSARSSEAGRIVGTTITSDTQERNLKQQAAKKAEFKEIVIENLHRKDMKGVNLRIRFWMTSIMKSVWRNSSNSRQKAMLSEMGLHGIQKLVFKSIVTFLAHQRDIVENLTAKGITEVEDFEWQSQVRLFWTGVEPACKVLCGGWSGNQQNEYLGSQPRLVVTPLTNRYFVFISSALRDKSAVLFNA